MVTDGDGDIIYLAHEVENLNAGWDSAEEALAGIGEVCEYSVSTDRHTDWTFYFFKSKASISRAVFQLLREEIPLIIFSVVVLVFLGLFFSGCLRGRSKSLPGIWTGSITEAGK